MDPDPKRPLMVRERFSDASPGRLEPVTLSKRGLGPLGEPVRDRIVSVGFVPDPLPPDLDWRAIKAELFDELDAAGNALSRVNGLLHAVPSTDILRHGLWLREARLSSQIEGIETTALDMVLAGASGEAGEGANPGLEAWNAVKAVRFAWESNEPFGPELLGDMHRELLVGVRGGDKRPGEYRDGPVYIGSPRWPDKARFVPPPPEHVGPAMDALGRFATSTWADIPGIACVALEHYQFETIHPFRDGNGRIGRALILHQLCRRGLLELPIVSVSADLQARRQEYVDRLFAVSADGDWAGWIRFFAEAVARGAAQTRSLAERIVALHREYAERLRAHEAQARHATLLDYLFEQPVVSAKRVETLLGVSNPTARKDIEFFEELGILRLTEEVAYGKTWYAPVVLGIVEDDAGATP
ncbi:MAG: Fic family protein [Planctomycetota bacterium]